MRAEPEAIRVRRNRIGLVLVAGLLLNDRPLLNRPGALPGGRFQPLMRLQLSVQAILADFTIQAFTLIRALAIGLFAVFLALGVMAARRGVRARAALVVVTA